MPKVPGLFSRKGGGWTFRVRVPDHLRSELGKREIWKSLGSVDYREAARLARIERVNADRLFVEAEARLKAEVTDELSEAQLFHLARSFFFRLEQKSGGLPSDRFERNDLVERVREDLSAVGQTPDDPALQQVAHSVLQAANVRLRDGAQSFHRLCELIQEALIEHYQRDENRLLYRPEPRTNRMFADLDRFHPPAQRLTLVEAIRRYEDDPQRLSVAEKTKATWKFRFGAWIDLLGAERAVSEITRDQLRAAVATLMRVPANAAKHFPGMSLQQAVLAGEKAKLPKLSAKSVQLYIDCLNALFRFLTQEELVARNPVAGLKGPKVEDDESRRPWSLGELAAFFSAPPFDRPWSDTGSPSWLFWLPLLGLFSGARQGELAGLLGADLVEAEGRYFIAIRPNRLRDLKTKQSARLVPIHPELVACGFVDFARATEPDQMVFSDIPLTELGPIAWVQKKLGKHIRKRVSDELVVFHSFRHNFRDAARHIGMPDEIVGAIGGWKEGRTSAMSNYGRGHREATLAAWMDRIEYPGLSLVHLYRATY